MGQSTPNVVNYSDGPWEDIVIPVAALGTGPSAPDLVAFGPSGNLKLHAFDGGSTTEQLYGSIEALHAWKEGTAISFHIHWAPTTANTGNVKWQLEVTIADGNGTFGAPTTLDVTAAAGGTAWVHKLSAFPDVSGTGYHIGAIGVFRLFRNPSDAADTYPDDAVVMSIGVHYQRDTPGSVQRTSKT